MSDITIQYFERAAELPADDWNELANGTAFTSSAYLRTIEEYGIKPLRPRFLLAYSNGKLAGGTVLEMVEDADRENGVVRSLLGRNRIARALLQRHLSPNLTVGAPLGYGGHLLLAKGMNAGQRSLIALELVTAAERLAESLSCPLWFAGVLATDTTLLEALRSSGFLSARYLPVADIAIKWRSFDDYVEALKSRSRSVAKDIRREQNRCRTAGITFGVPSSERDCSHELLGLSNQTYRRHGSGSGPFASGYFSALQDRLGDDFLVCTACRGKHIVGFVTMLSDGTTAWADSYGLDYDHPDSAFVYFNLVFQWPIRKAIEIGLERVVFGRGQYQLKSRRGCETTDSYLLTKPSNRAGRIACATLLQTVSSHYAKQSDSSIAVTRGSVSETRNRHRTISWHTTSANS